MSGSITVSKYSCVWLLNSWSISLHITRGRGSSLVGSQLQSLSQ